MFVVVWQVSTPRGQPGLLQQLDVMSNKVNELKRRKTRDALHLRSAKSKLDLHLPQGGRPRGDTLTNPGVAAAGEGGAEGGAADKSDKSDKSGKSVTLRTSIKDGVPKDGRTTVSDVL